MIRVEQLENGSARYRGGRRDIHARDGAITGLLGPNGAGKTTTLRMLYAVMKPDAGSIRSMTSMRSPRRSRRRGGSACCPTASACIRG